MKRTTLLSAFFLIFMYPVISQVNITCPSESEFQCFFKVPVPFQNFTEFVHGGGVAESPCGIDESTFTYLGQTITGVCPRTILRTYSVTDSCDDTGTCTQVIIQNDTEPPSINAPVDISIVLGPGECELFVEIAQAEAADDCGVETLVNDMNGTGNASGIYPVGTTVVTWTATDSCGNIATAVTTITLEDVVPPIITCPPSVTVGNDPGQCLAFVSVPEPSVTENCLIEILYNSYNGTDDASDTYFIGTFIVNWYVYDASGNLDFCSQTITVADDEFPVMIIPSDTTVYVHADSTSAYIEFDEASASDNCGLESFSNDFSVSADITATYPAGLTTVTWTAVDINGNEAIETTRVVVQPLNNIGEISKNTVLTSNFPDPFTGSTRIGFTLKDPSPVTLKIYNHTGLLILSRDLGMKDRGEHYLQWEPVNCESGLYYYLIETSGGLGIGKMILSR